MFGRVERSQRRLQKLTQPVATRLWDIETVGFDRIPADGPAILCPNHISFLDSAFLMLTTERTIGFLGKAEYMDSWKPKHFFPAMGMIPVDRSGGKNSMDALRAALDVLESGGLMGIFPEGTRRRTGHLYKGRTGAARLALSVGCPVLPVGITGTDRIQPPDAPMPSLRGSARIEIGEPVDPQKFVDLPGPKAAARSPTRSCTRCVNSPASSTGTTTPVRRRSSSDRSRCPCLRSVRPRVVSRTPSPSIVVSSSASADRRSRPAGNGSGLRTSCARILAAWRTSRSLFPTDRSASSPPGRRRWISPRRSDRASRRRRLRPPSTAPTSTSPANSPTATRWPSSRPTPTRAATCSGTRPRTCSRRR